VQIITDVKEMREIVEGIKQSGQSIGFVPTMGYLHFGHLALITAARKQNNMVAASIFVNPAQFGPEEDFERYPRDVEADSIKAKSAGVDLLFCPKIEDIYGAGYATYVETEGLSEQLCGKSRPGHFRGVCTVVLKLFNIVQPKRAYFGQKDAQQFIILKRMTLDLNLDIEMICLPIVREADGLAMSSRNIYLTEQERRKATVLNCSLNEAKQLYDAGERNAQALLEVVEKKLLKVKEGRLDYAELVDLTHLLPITKIDKPALLALAMYFGQTRLIDNVILQ